MGVEHDIWLTVARANQAWIDGRPRDVADLYASDAVVVAPDLQTVLRGREAIVQSYEDYVAHAATEDFTVDARHIHVRDDMAVATYRYRVRYRADGETHDEQGQEVLVLRADQGHWIVTWRTQVPGPT